MPHIRIWVYNGILASGVAGSIDVFTAANVVWAERNGDRRGASPLFQWRIESLDGRPVQTASGQILSVDGAISARTVTDAVIVTGPFVANIERFFERSDLLQPLLSALRRQHERGALLASYCTGSFILAEAGLLDGGVATTHWAKAKVFARRYPEVNLRVSEILTEQNRILCSGAVTTSLNLALRLVEKFAGANVAAATGRMMLIDTNRVSQSSYAVMQDEQAHSDALVARAQRWMERSLQQGFSLGELARHLAVSERTLNRRFKLAVGEAPLRYLQSLRVDVAKRLLETRGLNVDAVSERVGYHDLSTFRRLFKRETGLSPREYQRRFSRRRQGRGAPPSGSRDRPVRRPCAKSRQCRNPDVRFSSKDGDTATIGQAGSPLDVALAEPPEERAMDPMQRTEKGSAMPMIDALIPEGALKPEAEERLLRELTDILLTHEGYEPANKVAQSVSVIFLHRPAAVFVAGSRSASARYRIIPTVPEGQYNEASRKALVKDVTDAVVRADGGKYEDVAPRVWVFPTEIPDGQWGGRGVIRLLPDIHAFIAGEHERKVGEERLARRRRVKALAMLEGALDATRKGAG